MCMPAGYGPTQIFNHWPLFELTHIFNFKSFKPVTFINEVTTF